MSLAFLRGQPAFMRARGIESAAVSSPGPDLNAFGRSEGVPVHAVEMPRRITPLRDLVAVHELRRVLRTSRPTIVHAHTPKGGLLGMIAATVSRVPIRVYHMRGLPVLGATGLKRLVLRLTERISCRLAHSVVCVGHSLREVAIAEGICPPDKIRVLADGSGQGVDARGRFDPDRLGGNVRRETRVRLGIPIGATVLGYVGRLVRDKGIIELERAWQLLRDEHPDLHLLLVGPFESQDPVPQDVADRLTGDRRVHLAGMDWNTPPLYAAMDLVALPTYREGFPNVPLEAAAMRLAVIATRVPGCVEAVSEGVTGLLVPPGDSEALADAVRVYLADPALRQEHGEAGRARVLRAYSPDRLREALYQEYLRLLRAAGRVPLVESSRAGIPSGAKHPGGPAGRAG